MSNQLRGMLLEEALLHLLKRSGYKTIEFDNQDETLINGSAGLKVKGRGESHQIDAIADYRINVPFIYPQRLLVEAKCLNQKVGLPIIRNALGVLKDVQEFWVSNLENNIPGRKRYHYQYAVFSATQFTKPAQNYGFAQDIYLIQLEESVFIQPIIQSISTINNPDLSGGENYIVSIKQLRSAIRQRIQLDNPEPINNLNLPSETLELLRNYIESVESINGAVLTVIKNNLVLFLVPSPDVLLTELDSRIDVRIFWDNTGWYIRDANTHNLIFSFDLPKELFQMYESGGYLRADRALDLKQDFMSELQLFLTIRNETRIVRLILDQDWISSIRRGMREK